MNYGKIVAERYKKQYFKYKKWKIYSEWPMQPEAYYLICKELKSKLAINLLLGRSWTRRLPRIK